MNRPLFALLRPPTAHRSTWLGCLVAASGGHLLCAVLLASEASPAVARPVTEVMLEPALPAPPPPPPPPSPPTEPEPPPPAAEPPPKRAARGLADPPAVARAGAVLTAPETAEPTPEEPVRFVSDPNGQSYGTGIVARGGLAGHGTGNTIAPPPPAPVQATEPITPANRLRRQPLLIGDGCRGHFPEHARPDQGFVTLIATVQSNGAIARLAVDSESPPGEGFAKAARSCLARRRFTPALDERGEATAARTRIHLRFTR